MPQAVRWYLIQELRSLKLTLRRRRRIIDHRMARPYRLRNKIESLVLLLLLLLLVQVIIARGKLHLYLRVVMRAVRGNESTIVCKVLLWMLSLV